MQICERFDNTIKQCAQVIMQHYIGQNRSRNAFQASTSKHVWQHARIS